MTTWYCDNGDGLDTGYWGIAPWQRAVSYATGSIVRQQCGRQWIAIAQDFTNGKIWFKNITRNGYWNDSATADPATNTGGFTNAVTGALFPAVACNNQGWATANFGASTFLGTIPSGFQSVNAANGSPVTWNPSDAAANYVLSNGNLTWGQTTSWSTSTWYAVRATASFTSDLIYWEVSTFWGTFAANGAMLERAQLGAPQYSIGLANSTYNLGTNIGQSANDIGWQGTNNVWKGGSSVGTMHAYNPVTWGNERAYRNNGSAFTSGATQPNFPTGNGATVADGTGTWTEVTGQAAYGWMAAWSKMDFLQSNRAASVGDIVYVGDDHRQATEGIQVVNLSVNPTGALLNYISMDHTVASPGASDYKAGATMSFKNVISCLEGNFYLKGFNIVANTSGSSTSTLHLASNNFAISNPRYDDCAFQNLSTTNGSLMVFGSIQSATGNTQSLEFNNCTYSASMTGDRGLRIAGARTVWRGGSFTTAGSKEVVRADTGCAPCDVLFDGVDFSGVTGPNFWQLGTSTTMTTILAQFVRCKLPSATFLQQSGSAIGYPENQWYACDNGTDLQSHGKANPKGIMAENKVLVRTGGATDGLAAYSDSMITTSICAFAYPFVSLPFDIWNATTGSARTLTVYGIANSATVPTNADIWPEMRYFGDAASLNGSLAYGGAANIISAGMNWTVDTVSAWDGGTVAARANGETLAVGAIRKVSSNPGRVFFCTAITTGILSGSLPGGYATAVDGGVVTDGGATMRAGFRFSMSVAASSPKPQLAGLVTLVIKIAKPSATYYIDPIGASSLT
jgi:hypothetical protein